MIQTGGLRHDRLAVEPNSEGCIGLSIRTPFGSERTGHCHDPAGQGPLTRVPHAPGGLKTATGTDAHRTGPALQAGRARSVAFDPTLFSYNL